MVSFFFNFRLSRTELRVNAAGISGSRQTIENTPFDEYERVIKITSTSVFLGCKIAAPELFKAGRKGSVINVASMMSHIGGTLVFFFLIVIVGLLIVFVGHRGNNPGYHGKQFRSPPFRDVY